MKKIFITTILLFFAFFYSKIHSAEFDIKAKTVILQDFLSGKILFEKELSSAFSKLKENLSIIHKYQ